MAVIFTIVPTISTYMCYGCKLNVFIYVHDNGCDVGDIMCNYQYYLSNERISEQSLYLELCI
jgi:hypothetical protein